MRQVLLCSMVLAATACAGIAPAKAIPQPKESNWSIVAGLAEKAGWRRYYRHYRYYPHPYGYYPPPYIFYPPPYPYYPPPYGYDLPYHYRYYPPY
jgi:hypothetical protein